jgi:hypothetical protein
VNQNVATDHKVKSSVVHEGFNRRFVKDRCLKPARSARSIGIDWDLRIPVNSNDPARGTHQFSCQHGYISRSATQIQNAYTRPDSGASEKTLRDRPQNLRLRLKAKNLSLRMAKDIASFTFIDFAHFEVCPFFEMTFLSRYSRAIEQSCENQSWPSVRTSSSPSDASLLRKTCAGNGSHALSVWALADFRGDTKNLIDQNPK